MDDLPDSDSSVIDRIEQITGKRPTFYQVDIADKGAIEQIFAAHDIDAVIHFAGYKAVGESVEKPLAYYRNNLDTTLTLLETMQRHDVKKFIFSSSATVYSMAEGMPFTEQSGPLGCTNPYGWTKYMIEQMLRDVAAADSKMSVVLLRYFNPIGAHESGLIGEKPNGIPNNLMPYITQVAKGKLPYEVVGRRAGDMAECYADTTKTETVLGWKAERGIEEMCRDAWRWECRQGA